MDIIEAGLTNFKVSKRHPWELARLEVVIRLIKDIQKNSTFKKLNILDIGCGDTFVAENLSVRLPVDEYIAVDTAFTTDLIETYRTKLSEQKLNIRLFFNIDEAMQNISSEISIILLLDVIEHIEHESNFLKSITMYPVISKNTIFIITVPAFQSLFCSHDVFLGHFRRYTSKSLSITVSKANLKVIGNGYFFTSLLMARAFNVFTEKIVKPKIVVGIGNWGGRKLTQNLIRFILSLDFYITRFFRKAGIKIIGLTNYAICKKSVL